MMERPSATLDAESFAEYFSTSGDLDWCGADAAAECDVSGVGVGAGVDAQPPPRAPLLSVPTKPRHPVEMFYLEDLAGEASEDGEDKEVALDGMGAKLSLALLEAQDEMLERELQDAEAEERASDALEAGDEGDDDDDDDEDDDDDDSEEWEDLEVEVEEGAKGRKNKRIANRVRTLRRAVEMRRADGVGDGGVGRNVVVSRAARQAVRCVLHTGPHMTALAW